MKTMTEYRYKVEFERDEDGVVIVSCPALPSCTSYGYTKAEAVANIREVMQLVLEELLAEGEPIPPLDPSPEAISVSF